MIPPLCLRNFAHLNTDRGLWWWNRKHIHDRQVRRFSVSYACGPPLSYERQTPRNSGLSIQNLDDGWKLLFMMPNSDTGGRRVAELIREWSVARSGSVKAISSLGRRHFYSAMHKALAMVRTIPGLNPYEKDDTLGSIYYRLLHSPLVGVKTFMDI